MKKKQKLLFRQILTSSLPLLLIPFYQNCSPTSFESTKDSASTLKFGNGDPYAGKPTGNFYRYIPDFTCENQELPASLIEISSAGTQLTENKKLLCGAIKKNLDPSLLDTSIYQKEVIGYQEGIFEGESTLPTKIPANLVEIWCKDRNGVQGIETLTHFDRTSHTAVNRIYYSTTAADGSFIPREISDYSVARVLASKTVSVKDGKGFELQVHRDQPAAQLGQFKAHMEAMIEGQKISLETSCRLGGSLDPKVWPAQQIVDLDSTLFQFSPDLSQIAFSSSTATRIATLYASTLDGSSQKQISPKMQQYGIDGMSGYFKFSPDSQWLIYNGDAQQSGVMELFKTKIDGSMTVPLITGRSVYPNFKVTESTVIFEDASFAVKAVSLAGGPLVDLSPPPPTQGNGSALWGIATGEDKVVYAFGDFLSQPEIYSIRIDGTGMQKITPPFSTGDWKQDPYRNIKILPGNRYVVVTQVTRNFSPNFQNYLIAIDGSGSTKLAIGMEASFSSPNGNHVLLSQGLKSFILAPTQLLNVKTGSLFPISALPFSIFDPDGTIIKDSLFFTQDSRALITPVLVNSDHIMKAVSISTHDGTETELCPGLQSESISIREESANRYLISSYDKASRVLSIYRAEKNSSCRKLNSTIVANTPQSSIAEISISPDRQKLLVRTGVFTGGASKTSYGEWIPHPTINQLIYIPLDGKPAFLIDSPVFKGAEITHASFLSDSRRVLFRGNQINPNEYNVFLWTAP